MTDRELLELAAKAYFPACASLEYPLDWVRDCHGEWNPLTDDGDALRLAVKLNIHLAIECESAGIVEVTWDFDESGDAINIIEQDAPLGGDDYAATRRAITRAAAEIGKTL